MNEIWLSIIGFEELYEVSNLGRIKSLRRLDSINRIVIEKVLKLQKIVKGYIGISLCKNGIQCSKRVHRLVLESFVGSCPSGMECNHKNGIKTDNRLENLEWVTASENSIHKYRTLHPGCRQGSKHSQTKLTEQNVLEIRRLCKENYSTNFIVDKFNITKNIIYKIKHRRSWKHI